MTRTFPALIFKGDVQLTYKVVANFRSNSITIYQKYGNAPYLKSYYSTSFLERKDIFDIMFEYNEGDLRLFILKQNFSCGKIRPYLNRNKRLNKNKK